MPERDNPASNYLQAHLGYGWRQEPGSHEVGRLRGVVIAVSDDALEVELAVGAVIRIGATQRSALPLHSIPLNQILNIGEEIEIRIVGSSLLVLKMSQRGGFLIALRLDERPMGMSNPEYGHRLTQTSSRASILAQHLIPTGRSVNFLIFKPGPVIEEELSRGTVMEGEVKDLTNELAAIEIQPGVYGYLKIEIHDVLRVGDRIQVEVQERDPNGLYSLKRTKGPQAPEQIAIPMTNAERYFDLMENWTAEALEKYDALLKAIEHAPDIGAILEREQSVSAIAAIAAGIPGDSAYQLTLALLDSARSYAFIGHPLSAIKVLKAFLPALDRIGASTYRSLTYLLIGHFSSTAKLVDQARSYFLAAIKQSFAEGRGEIAELAYEELCELT